MIYKTGAVVSWEPVPVVNLRIQLQRNGVALNRQAAGAHQHHEINTWINMTDITSSGGYTISTLSEKQRDGIHGIAYCPICDKAEESHDHGNGEKHAITISIGKVRLHMRLIHHVKDSLPGTPHYNQRLLPL